MNEYDSTTDDASQQSGVDQPTEATSIPEVGELEERLRHVDAAMELLQSGELDAAEAAIEELERRTSQSTSD